MLLLAFLFVSFFHAFPAQFSSSPRDIESKQKELEVKWNHFGKIRRFTIISEECCVYDELKKALHTYEPKIQGFLSWIDNENDSVLLNSSNELNSALKYKSNRFLRLNTIDEEVFKYQAMKGRMMHHSLQREIFVKELLGDKEIEIEFDINLSSEVLEQFAKKQGIWPIIIIRNSKPDFTEDQISKNQTGGAEQTTARIKIRVNNNRKANNNVNKTSRIN
ncbi:hypothetical protein ACH3XW_2720 [Acanthocheilonema viteae]